MSISEDLVREYLNTLGMEIYEIHDKRSNDRIRLYGKKKDIDIVYPSSNYTVEIARFNPLGYLSSEYAQKVKMEQDRINEILKLVNILK